MDNIAVVEVENTKLLGIFQQGPIVTAIVNLLVETQGGILLRQQQTHFFQSQVSR